MMLQRRFKKSAIGASSVTLVPTTVADPQMHPKESIVQQVVVSTNSGTPPASFWGTATADGIEYLVTIERVT